jgi:hypothetical protein
MERLSVHIIANGETISDIDKGNVTIHVLRWLNVVPELIY